jgi:hypothetical protein
LPVPELFQGTASPKLIAGGGQQRLAAVQFDGTVASLPMPVLGMSTKRLAGIPQSQVCTCLPSVVLCPAATALLEVAARLPEMPPPLLPASVFSTRRCRCASLPPHPCRQVLLVAEQHLFTAAGFPDMTATAGAGPAARRQRDAIQIEYSHARDVRRRSATAIGLNTATCLPRKQLPDWYMWTFTRQDCMLCKLASQTLAVMQMGTKPKYKTKAFTAELARKAMTELQRRLPLHRAYVHTRRGMYKLLDAGRIAANWDGRMQLHPSRGMHLKSKILPLSEVVASCGRLADTGKGEVALKRHDAGSEPGRAEKEGQGTENTARHPGSEQQLKEKHNNGGYCNLHRDDEPWGVGISLSLTAASVWRCLGLRARKRKHQLPSAQRRQERAVRLLWWIKAKARLMVL